MADLSLGLKKQNAFVGSNINTSVFGGSNTAPANQAQSSSLFGNTTPANTGTQNNLFGQSGAQPQNQTNQNTQNPSQAPAINVFGAQTATQNTPNTGGSLFGQQTTQAPQTSLFGGTSQPTPAGGTGTSLFGNNTTPAGLNTQQQQPGQPAPGQTTSLFGGQTNQQPAATGSLFGQPNKPPATTGSLFGQPGGTTSGFGFPAQQPAASNPPSLFGVPQGQQQQPGLFGAAPLPPQLQLISLTQAEHHKRALPVPDPKVHKLNPTNLFRQRPLSRYPHADVQETAWQVETLHKTQTEKCNEVVTVLNDLEKQQKILSQDLIGLKTSFEQDQRFILQIDSQIQSLKCDMMQLGQHSAEMHSLFDCFESGRVAVAPFRFFYTLQAEQEEQVSKLNVLVDRAQQVAADLISGRLKPHNDVNQVRMPLKQRIFEICAMLFEQQKKEAAFYQTLEQKISAMKQQFKTVMLENNTWATPSDIDKLFTHSAILTQDVNKNFRKIRSSQVSESLSKQFDTKMAIGSKKSSDTTKATDSNQSTPLTRQKVRSILTQRSYYESGMEPRYSYMSQGQYAQSYTIDMPDSNFTQDSYSYGPQYNGRQVQSIQTPPWRQSGYSAGPSLYGNQPAMQRKRNLKYDQRNEYQYAPGSLYMPQSQQPLMNTSNYYNGRPQQALLNNQSGQNLYSTNSNRPSESQLASTQNTTPGIKKSFEESQTATFNNNNNSQSLLSMTQKSNTSEENQQKRAADNKNLNTPNFKAKNSQENNANEESKVENK